MEASRARVLGGDGRRTSASWRNELSEKKQISEIWRTTYRSTRCRSRRKPRSRDTVTRRALARREAPQSDASRHTSCLRQPLCTVLYCASRSGIDVRLAAREPRLVSRGLAGPRLATDSSQSADRSHRGGEEVSRGQQQKQQRRREEGVVVAVD